MATTTDIALRIIDARDLADLTKSSMSTAYTLLKSIRKHYGKESHQLVLNTEAAAYLGIEVRAFESILNGL
ncbi:hypothetical protein [Croceibacter atlanticus]|uniref:hypothetical protein n=1 Tax=Croceibacter atlanticus TaxID=313588 RepID=UPI002E0D3563|nr:hypothetical protein VVL01_00235 [Croceibacter atlanticus]